MTTGIDESATPQAHDAKSTDKARLVANNHRPLVSVVIPAFECSEFIAETLQSLFAQTFTNYETIVVNDGSLDAVELESVLKPFFDKIVYIKQQNAGVAAARNTAIRVARGEYLAFLDSDDIWHPTYLATQIEQIKTRNCDMIYSDAVLFGEGIASRIRYSANAPSFGPVNTESLISAKCNVITSGTVVRRKSVIEVGMFDETLPKICFEDFDLWFRIAKSGYRIKYHTSPLLKYRVRANSLSGDSVRQIERAITAYHFLKGKYQLNDSELKSIDRQIEVLSLRLEVVRIKYSLVVKDFESAQKHLDDILVTSPSFKLKIIDNLLRFCPKLLRATFRCLRRREFDFILSASR